MIFSIIGMVHLFKYHRKVFIGIFTFSILNLWIISSWWCWWYGGSYSQRVFIDSLPVMAFPLAALTEHFRKSNSVKKLLIYLLAGLFIVHNLFQTYKYVNNAIHWDSMSRSAYINTAFRLNPDKEFFFKIIPPDYENALLGKPERSISFESKSKKQYAFINSIFTPQHYVKLPDESEQNGQISRHDTIHELIRKTTGNAFFTRYEINNEHHFIQGASIPTEKLVQIRTLYVAAGYFIKPAEQIPLHGAGLVMTFENTENQSVEIYHYEPADRKELQAGRWNFRYFIIEMPSIAHPENTRFHCYFWNVNGKARAFVQDVSAFAILKHQNIKE